MATVTKSIKGKMYTVSREDVEKILGELEPEPMKGRAKYYVEFEGKKFPIKQVVAEVTGLPRIAFTAKHAYDLLTELGFEVKEER
ncbi:hypothetical protein DRP04_02770 [Archaeoglobales archaeon]|nr:MAG: hypothetical protein DRP04_02770 [Archaeoglobales archaeon]